MLKVNFHKVVSMDGYIHWINLSRVDEFIEDNKKNTVHVCFSYTNESIFPISKAEFNKLINTLKAYHSAEKAD